MGRDRPDLGFAAELERFDPEAWPPAPPPRAAPSAPAAAAAGFRSREPAAPSPEASAASAPPRRDRRRRTGRNAQLNLKLRPDTIEEFCAIADTHDWGLGETFERALALLRKAHPPKG